ncbi:hypothetical protein FOQG_09272 [Fusarium oxysporum f. sp. raphani 54005]|uniref:Uncharacterized protein n=1 Tax=Fusarium oxysporum f. sp. raphani 54005 TaxID=1089458 RepID=X0BZ68_FUSOX|nr:hypothetical protein FOQG_09272 [Fusarium oxysporum f. sp. raphani 54005]
MITEGLAAADARPVSQMIFGMIHQSSSRGRFMSGAKTRASKILTPKSRGKKQADPKPDPKSTKSSKTPITSRKPTRDQIEDWSTGEVPETVKAGKRKLQEGFTTATKIKKPRTLDSTDEN